MARFDVSKAKIGQSVRVLREQAGKSQDDLAGFLGLPRVSITQLEAGKRELSSIELAKVSEFFGVPADLILTGDKMDQHIYSGEVKKEPFERVAIPKLKKNKFKEVLLYVLEKTAGKPNVG
jgi:transcriptional regulator with XRE-family HTH domain